MIWYDAQTIYAQADRGEAVLMLDYQMEPTFIYLHNLRGDAPINLCLEMRSIVTALMENATIVIPLTDSAIDNKLRRILRRMGMCRYIECWHGGKKSNGRSN